MATVAIPVPLGKPDPGELPMRRQAFCLLGEVGVTLSELPRVEKGFDIVKNLVKVAIMKSRTAKI
jgi:hypothetical protein